MENVSDISEYLSLLSSAYSLNDEYESLIQNLSETDDTTELDSLYGEFNNDSIQQLFLNLVNGADLTDESIVNQLLAFDHLDQDSAAYTKLMEALENLNKVTIKDNDDFTGEEQGDYLLINGLGNITVGDLINNIEYNGTITTTSENSDLVTSSVELVFMDSAGQVVKTLKVLLKNDLDNNGVVDNNDLEILKSLVNDSSNVTDEMLLVADTNSDGVLNQEDIDNLYNLLNPSEEDDTSGSSSEEDASIPVSVIDVYTTPVSTTSTQPVKLSNSYTEAPRVVSNLVQEKPVVDQKEDVNKDNKDKKKDQEKKKITIGTIIKIALIILLGGLIIYFLNKDSKDDEEEKKKKKQ